MEDSLGTHTQTLWLLAQEVLSPTETDQFRVLLQAPTLDYQGLLAFDRSLGGPSLDRVSCNGHGLYETADRAVFRPLQYVAVYFKKLDEGSELDWLARSIVYNSSLQFESLIKNIGRLGPLP
jgi:hypothetical protein